MKILKKFDEDISFWKLSLYWICFLAFGIFLMLIITPIHPSFSEQHNEISENLCEPINLIFVCLAFAVETTIFFILTWKIWGMKGVKIGIIIWAILHLIGGSFPIFVYICVMGLFYYRLLEIRKWKSCYLFHFLINLPAIFSCLL